MESVHGIVAGLDVHKKTVVAVVLQATTLTRIMPQAYLVQRGID